MFVAAVGQRSDVESRQHSQRHSTALKQETTSTFPACTLLSDLLESRGGNPSTLSIPDRIMSDEQAGTQCFLSSVNGKRVRVRSLCLDWAVLARAVAESGAMLVGGPRLASLGTAVRQRDATSAPEQIVVRQG